MFLINFISVMIALVLGFYIMFVGRSVIWATLGIIAFFVTANLLTVMIAGQESIRDLVASQAWDLLGIAVIIAFLGIVLGRVKPDLAVLVIGFAAGADTSLWFYDIAAYVVTTIARQSQQAAIAVGLGVALIGGLLGVWLVRKVRDESLILITMLVGAQIIRGSLGLSQTSSWTAIIMIILGLAGVLVQYAGYLREIKASQRTLEPQPSSVAYFQDLELD